MAISMGIALGVQNQMQYAILLEDKINKPAAEIMRAMADVGLKFMPDEADIMRDAAKLYPKLLEDDGTPNLSVVKE